VVWLSFLPSDKHLLVGREIAEQRNGIAPGPIEVWDITKGSVLRRLAGAQRRLTSADAEYGWETIDAAALSPPGRTLAITHGDNRIRVWDVVTGRKLRELDPHTGKAQLIFTSNDAFMFTGWDNTRVGVYNWRQNQMRMTPVQLRRSLFFPAFTVSAKQVWIGAYGDRVLGDGFVGYDVASGQQRRLIKTRTGDAFSSIFPSPDGTRLISVYKREAVHKVWNTQSETAQMMYTLPGSGDETPVAFSPDGTMVASATNQAVNIHRVGAGTLYKTLLHQDRVTALAFSQDGTRLGVGFDDSTVKLWQIK
jgi:WD40 repeat protein